VFQTHSGDRIAQFQFQEPVRSLAMSPGGTSVAAALADHTVRVVGTQTGHEYPAVRLQEEATAMALAPDDSLVAIAASDRTAGAFDAATGRQISRFENEHGINDIAFSHDGSLLAVATGLTGGNVIPGGAGVFEPRTGHGVARLSHEADVSHVAATPDGRLTATISGQIIRLVDTREHKEIGRIDRLLREQLRAATLAISADGSLLAVGAEMRAKTVAFVFESRSGRELVRLEDTADTSAVSFNEFIVPFQVAFSPDASLLALTSHHKAMVIDPRTGRELIRLEVGGNGYAVAFSSDGKSVVVGTRGSTRIFDAGTGQPTAELDHPAAQPRAVALSADGRRVAVAFGGNEALVFATASQREIARLWQPDDQTGLTINADGTLVAIASTSKRKDESASAHVFEVSSGREVARMAFPEPIKFLTFVDNGRRLRLATGKTELAIADELVLSSDLVAEACSKVHRNLTESEWANYVRSGSRAKTCPQLTR
jgi:WD40 repeat protein